MPIPALTPGTADGAGRPGFHRRRSASGSTPRTDTDRRFGTAGVAYKVTDFTVPLESNTVIQDTLQQLIAGVLFCKPERLAEEPLIFCFQPAELATIVVMKSRVEASTMGSTTRSCPAIQAV